MGIYSNGSGKAANAAFLFFSLFHCFLCCVFVYLFRLLKRISAALQLYVNSEQSPSDMIRTAARALQPFQANAVWFLGPHEMVPRRSARVFLVGKRYCFCNKYLLFYLFMGVFVFFSVIITCLD